MGSIATLTASGKWVLEPKMDGWRLLVYVAEDGIHLYTHTGSCHDGKLPAIEAEFAQLPPGTWIDGEAVSFKIDGAFVVHEWNSVQKCLGAGKDKAIALSDSITYVAFDLISHAGIDARSLPFSKRRDLLEAIFMMREWERVILTPQALPSDEQLEAFVAQGFEGGVIKNLGARYASGQRGQGQLKLKPQETDDFVVMDYKPGESGFTGMVGAIVFGSYREGALVERGRCSGMDMAMRLRITKTPEAFLGKVVEVKHMGHMKDGFRHPQFLRWRPDKTAKECVA